MNTSNYTFDTSNVITIDANLKILNTTSYVRNTSNILEGRIDTKVGVGNADMALVFDVQILNTSKYVGNTSNAITTRIDNLPAPQNYVLLEATATVRGGIRVGNNQVLDGDILNATFNTDWTRTINNISYTIGNVGIGATNPERR